MVGRDLHPKEPWNTFPQVHPSPQHTLESARARAPPPTGEASNLRAHSDGPIEHEHHVRTSGVWELGEESSPP
jgi:hypothetical protein